MISTSTVRKTMVFVLVIGFFSTFTAGYYYNQGQGFETDEHFSIPSYDSQEEIATKLVAPFIFITVLLHFALSRALNFILAEDVEEERYHRVPYAIPLRDEGHDRLHPDARKYAMIMSLTITASLIPTPYWDIIIGVMASIGTLTAVALGALFLYGFYNVARALN